MTRAAPLKVSALVVPKNGSSVRECEDSVGVGRSRMRFCVADGATEAFDSRHWARLLTKCWSLGADAVLSPQQFGEWLPLVGDRFDARWEGKRLPWYSEEKSEGAPLPPSPVWHLSAMDRICVGRPRRLAIHAFSG